MKPTATMDGKDMSAADTAPVTILQGSSPPERKGVTAKHVLAALTVIVCVAVVTGGMVAAIVMMKQSVTETNEQLTKAFMMNVHSGKQNIHDIVKTNKAEQTTEMEERDTSGRKQSVVFNDFKRGLTLYMSFQNDDDKSCYVGPLNRSGEMHPDALQKYLEDHPEPDVESEEEDVSASVLEPSEEPITDTAFLGTRINDMCRGRDIYWLFPKASEQSSEEASPAARQKRETCPHKNVWLKYSNGACRYYCCEEVYRRWKLVEEDGKVVRKFAGYLLRGCLVALNKYHSQCPRR